MHGRLYAICDADVCAGAGWSLTDFAAACLDGGATILQLRAKHASSRDFLASAEAIVTNAASGGGTIIVNDRADVACLSHAHGVHVGQDDLTPASVRLLLGASAEVGLSTHTPEQIEAAILAPISYLAVGPVFGTGTKDTGYHAVGLEMVRRAATATAGRLPVVAIGGITLERAPDVIGAGASAVAVISDLLVTGDPASRVRAYVERLGRV